MKLVMDGVFFQLTNTGIARVWSSILPRLAKYPDVEIMLLDRGNCPSIDHVERINFPSYTMNAYTAADSLVIEKYCGELGADVFSSTYYTTPASTPSVLIVYDMIPEVMGFNLAGRVWQEKQLAISFASYYACISENTRADLSRYYPATTNRSIVTHCGVEHRIFRPQDRSRVDDFKKRFGISKPYFLLVGSRKQGHGYKNAVHAFKAARNIRDFEFEFLCVGGEESIDPDVLSSLPSNASARRVDLKDAELACAYSGAEALVFPSLYEGFGMPIIEAMACSCPVITTRNGSLPEVAGDAAIFVSGRDVSEMCKAMMAVRERAHRAQLIEAGLRRAALYDWDAMTRGFLGLLRKAHKERETPRMRNFFDQWKRLRYIQAEVDGTT
jgi:glycosyltransferase involved in cell wall biosynthesis